MAQPFIGQVIAVGFNFAPEGWLLCQGQLLAIAEYSPLYNLIGTTYGGDGQTTFALPNLQERVALNSSPVYPLGQPNGTAQVTLTANEVASHTHRLFASAQNGTTTTPGPTTALAVNAQDAAFLYSPPPASVSLAPTEIGRPASGGSQPHENRQPYLTINYIICVNGIYPPQS